MRRLLLFLLIDIGATALTRHTGTNITRWSVSGVDVFLKMVLVAGQLFLALAYLCLLAQVFQLKPGEKLLYPLTLVGLKYWGSMGLAQLWLVALGIYLSIADDSVQSLASLFSAGTGGVVVGLLDSWILQVQLARELNCHTSVVHGRLS